MENAIGDFAADYREAREKFLAAASAAGARIETFDNPQPGPDGAPVHTDVALIGDDAAENVLIANSATHGVEGFCGSAALVGWLRTGEGNALASGTRAVLIHAINPHGFAWLRRVTEDNVDLNRNFVVHDGNYPARPAYDELHPVLVPKLWDDKSKAAREKAYAKYIKKHGEYGLQSAVTGGQYGRADGLFYGGRAATWSNTTFHAILENFVSGAEKIAFLDFHTGLGPYGYGTLLGGSTSGRGLGAWFGEGKASPSPGKSLSAPLSGVIGGAVRRQFPDAEVTSATVEFGTYPVPEVLAALLADNWIHLHGDPDSELGREIKAEIRKRLYPDEDDWKELVWLRSRQVLRRAARGLAPGVASGT